MRIRSSELTMNPHAPNGVWSIVMPGARRASTVAPTQIAASRSDGKRAENDTRKRSTPFASPPPGPPFMM